MFVEQKVRHYGLYGLFGLVFFFISALTPLQADDFSNLASFYANAPLKVGQFPTWETFFSVPNVFSHLAKVVWSHWNHETGRFSAALLLRVLTGMPHLSFAFLNAVVWTMFLHLLWKLSGLSASWKAMVFSLGVIFLLMSDACLWVAGVCNYLWPLTWTLALVLVFSSEWLKKPFFQLRNVWMVSLVPLGFCAAGGHELIALSTSIALCFYWFKRLIGKDLHVDGQFLMSLGYALGTCAVVFAPGTLSRAGGSSFFVPDAQLLYSFARKGMAFLRITIAFPVLLWVLWVTLRLLCSKKQQKLQPKTVWCLLWGWSTIVVTCFFSGANGREAWVAIALSLLMALVLLKESPLCKHSTFYIGGTAIALLFASAIYGVTLTKALENKRILKESLADWQESPYDVLQLEPSLHSSKITWFNRSFSIEGLFAWGIGDPWKNRSVARFYGRGAAIALDNFLFEELYRKDTVCTNTNKLSHIAGWYAPPGTDYLIHPLKPEVAKLGCELQGIPTYCDSPAPLDAMKRLRKRILRERWASFSLCSPEEEMIKAAPLTGFVLGTSHGYYAVLRLNRYIPREKLSSLMIFLLDKDNKIPFKL